MASLFPAKTVIARGSSPPKLMATANAIQMKSKSPIAHMRARPGRGMRNMTCCSRIVPCAVPVRGAPSNRQAPAGSEERGQAQRSNVRARVLGVLPRQSEIFVLVKQHVERRGRFESLENPEQPLVLGIPRSEHPQPEEVARERR